MIADWLMNMLDESEYVIETNKAMVDSFNKAPPLKSTSRKHPDLCIYRNYPDEKRRTIIQIEVHSGDFIMSLRKLALGLMDQLRVQRNVNDQIFSCCGFYFPAIDTQKTVVKVTLTWSDDAHIFKCIAEPIPLREVSNAINTAITQEVVKTLDFQTTQNNFAIPMSKSYIKNHFGDGAEQHSSGQSVVIINMSEQKVYKHPLHEKEGFRLMQLKDSPSINQCLLPHRNTVRVGQYLAEYFVYDLLHLLKLVDAKRYISNFNSNKGNTITARTRNCPSRH